MNKQRAINKDPETETDNAPTEGHSKTCIAETAERHESYKEQDLSFRHLRLQVCFFLQVLTKSTEVEERVHEPSKMY